MLRLLIIATALGLSSHALASTAKPAERDAAPTLLMSPVALPVVSDGHLVNYIYVNLRLTLSPKADADKLREKEPYFRDALVRAAHRTRLAPAKTTTASTNPSFALCWSANRRPSPGPAWSPASTSCGPSPGARSAIPRHLSRSRQQRRGCAALRHLAKGAVFFRGAPARAVARWRAGPRFPSRPPPSRAYFKGKT